MIPLAADENLNGAIVRGLRRRLPNVDLARMQDVGLREADDPAVRDWAAAEGRVVLTHDVRTMTAFAYERINAGVAMPGLFGIGRALPVASVIGDLVLIGMQPAR